MGSLPATSVPVMTFTTALARGDPEVNFHHDDLTGLLNRRASLRSPQPADQDRQPHTDGTCWLVYGDLDGFKKINDTFGHHEGDEVLIESATILREVFRESTLLRGSGGTSSRADDREDR